MNNAVHIVPIITNQQVTKQHNSKKNEQSCKIKLITEEQDVTYTGENITARKIAILEKLRVFENNLINEYTIDSDINDLMFEYELQNYINSGIWSKIPEK